jgi:hypothetical protein
MALYNITKLTQELLGAGLPIAGVSLLNSGTSVEISWQTTPTVQQLATAETVKAAHDPTDYNALERAAGRDSIRADAAASARTRRQHWQRSRRRSIPGPRSRRRSRKPCSSAVRRSRWH